VCAVAGAPFPTVILSDHDLTGTNGGELGYITCRPLDLATGARALRLAVRLGKLIVDLFP
jgi:hypothetical protein